MVCLFWFLKNKHYSFILIFGLSLIYLITLAIRTFYYKPRPSTIKYNNFLEKIDASSFPSVHSARVTFIFLFFVFYITKNLLTILILIFLTLFTYYSRIYLKKHDYIDVFGGIVLGILTFLLTQLIKI